MEVKKRRVLILSENFGSGHTKAANAIKDGIHYFDPSWDIRIVEIGAYLHPHLNKVVTSFYMSMLNYSPKIWRYLYRKNKYRMITPHFKYILSRFMYNELIRFINEYQPDLIIATHPFPSLLVAKLKKLGLNIPLHTVVTDFGIHGFWASREVDYYYVPSKGVKEQLMDFGISSEKISITGIPVHPKFWNKGSKTKIRAKLGLKDIPTLLFMGGGDGLGLSEQLIKRLKMFREKAQIIIVTGNNRKLYKGIQEGLLRDNQHLHLFGFVNNIDELMDAADLLITKPGGVTSSEAIVKGLPMILLEPIPGQEEENLKYIIENNLGISFKNKTDLENYISSFVENQSAFQISKFNKGINYSGMQAITQILNNIENTHGQTIAEEKISVLL